MRVTVTKKEFQKDLVSPKGVVYSQGVITGTVNKFDPATRKPSGVIETVEKKVFDDKNNPELMNKFHGLIVGQVYDLKYEMNARGYQTIVDIVPLAVNVAESATAVGKTVNSVKNTDNAIGAQVGNALNVAANLLASGKTADDLVAMAKQVLLKSEELKDILSNGRLADLAVTTQTVGKKSDVRTIELSDDLDIDDELPY